MDKSIKNEFNHNSFWKNFTIGALVAALVVDMMLGFPIAHYSIIGQNLTAFSSSVIVPPLDQFALWLGIEPVTQSAAAASAGMSSTVMATHPAFDACVAGGGMTHFHGSDLVCHP